MQLSRQIVIAAIITTSMIAGGCLPIPHPHSIRPSVDFLVRDSTGNPLDSARIILYTGGSFGERIFYRDTLFTNNNGDVLSPGQSKIHWFIVPLPEFEAGYIWAYCIQKPGYASSHGLILEEHADTLKVTLRYDIHGTPCPGNPKWLYDVAPEPWMRTPVRR